MTTASLKENVIEIKNDGKKIKNQVSMQKGFIYLTFTFFIFVMAMYILTQVALESISQKTKVY